jgi:hypothetical protein
MKLTRLVNYLLLAAVVALAQAVDSHGAKGDTSAVKSQTVNIELRDTQIKDAIDVLFKDRGLAYTVDPRVTGKIVELRITGVSFKQALEALCEAAGLSCTMTEGIYKICPAVATGAGPGTRSIVQSGSAAPQPRYAPPPAEAPQAAPSKPEMAPMQEESQTTQRSGNVIVSQTASPIYYTPPSPSGSGDGGWRCGGAPFTRVGNVGFAGGCGWGGGPVLVGGPSLFWQRSYPPPPPPGYVNPEVQRFLQGQYAITSRQYVVPIY